MSLLLLLGGGGAYAPVYWYGKAFLAILNKEVDWTADEIRVVLLADTYTPAQDTDDYFDDIVAHEVVGAGYTHEGALLGTPTIAYDAPTNAINLDGDDVTWSAATITARYAAIVDFTPGPDAACPLLCYIDFGANYASTADDFELVWHASGIAMVMVA